MVQNTEVKGKGEGEVGSDATRLGLPAASSLGLGWGGVEWGANSRFLKADRGAWSVSLGYKLRAWWRVLENSSADYKPA